VKSNQQTKLAEKTEYRKSIEYLAKIAHLIERGAPVGELIYDSNSQELAKHIRKVLHGAR
jgi:hypothetical protein